jgi:hypothetical protein
MTTTTETVPSQEKIILETLQAQPGVPIGMVALAILSGSMNVHTRAHSINHTKGRIVFNVKVRSGRTWHSYYYFRPLTDPNKEPEFIPTV